MKKNFVKKLALAMTMALVVSAVAPAANTASAAAAPAFKSTTANLKVGETKKYNVANSGNYSLYKAVVGTKSVAKVVNGGAGKGATKYVKITGLKEGKTTVRAELKNYATKKVVTPRIAVVVASDKAVLSSVTQTRTGEVAAKFSAALTAVDVANFSLVREDNVVFPIKSVALDGTDKTKVTITTFSGMSDGKKYTVTYDGKSVDFVATEGTVASLNVTPNTITAGKETEVKAQTLDAKGVILSETAFTGTLPAGVSCTIIPEKGYTNGSKLYLPEVGDTAKATLEYHTYKYDSEGNETGVIKNEFVITAVANATTVSNFNYTIKDDASLPVWNSASFEANKTVKVDTANQKAYFYIKDSNGDEIATADYADYKVVSSDSSKLLVAESPLSKGGAVSVEGVSAGVAYIVVKNAATGATVTTLQVTVAAKSKATTLNLSGTSFSVSTDIGTTVTPTIKDQYGNDMAAKTVTVELLSTPNNATLKNSTLTGKVEVVAGKVVLTPSAIVVNQTNDYGVYTFKVSATDSKDNSVSRTFSYNIVGLTPGATSTFDLVLSDTSVDTTVTNGTTDSGKTINVKVAEYKNGVQVNTVATMSAITLKKADGTTLASSANNVTCAAIADVTTPVSANSLNIVASTGTAGSLYTKNLEAGNYVITVESGGKTLTKSFTVKDTQGTGGYTVKTNEVAGGSLENFFKVTNNVQFSYGGVDQTITNITAIDASFLTNGNAYVRTVKAQVTIPGGSNNAVIVTYTINQTFTGNISGVMN